MAEYIKREIAQEDKWGKLQTRINELNLQPAFVNFSNSKFTIQEYLEIKDKMELLKSEISTLPLDNNETKFLNGKLDEILEQAKSLGRFDWQSLFIGTIISIVIQLSVTQENAQNLWKLIKRVFANIFLIE